MTELCPECGRVMNPDVAWWWTAYGATDTENCARLLVEREHAADARLL